MKTRLLHTHGQGYFEESVWEKSDPTEDEIEVKAIMTGVCRSDVAMMHGDFGPLPLEMQGHEGLGVVTKVGSNLTNVKIGDIVATRGEPAYADYYNVRKDEFVIVPEAHPRYILEPVACGVNLVTQPIEDIRKRSGKGKRCLILGSGFLSWVAYNTLRLSDIKFEEIIVVGNHNKILWGGILKNTHEGKFDVVIDISSNDDVLERDFVNNEALIIFGVQKTITSDFGNLLWKACSIVFPSPRTKKFIEAMNTANHLVSSGLLNVDKFWTRGYDRDSNWQEAFTDGGNRMRGYSRGYIVWKDHK